MRGRLFVTFSSAALVLIGVSGAASGAPHAARLTSAHIAPASSIVLTELSSSVLHVKGAHGTKLHMTVSAFHPAGGRAGTTIELSNGKPFVSGESHEWSFSLKKSSFSYNSKTGRAHLSTKKLLKSFGTIKLAFKKTRQSTAHCLDGQGPHAKVTTVLGHLSGKVFFNSKSRWGSFGSRKHKITFKGKNFVSLRGSGCPAGVGNGSASCASGVSWSGPSSQTGSIFGNVIKKGHRTNSTVSVDGDVTLSKPAGAIRSDYLVVKEPPPTVHPGTGSLDIKTSGSKVTGSATIGNTTVSPNHFHCKHAGKTRTEKVKDYAGTWSGTLTAHFAATGKQSFAGSTGFFSTESF